MSYTPVEVINVKKEECKACIKQTKLYMISTSVFLFASAALVLILKNKSAAELSDSTLAWFVAAEVLFMCSVLSGYMVLGSLDRSQDDGSFDAFCKATRLFSVLQFRSFIFGIVCFIVLAAHFSEK